MINGTSTHQYLREYNGKLQGHPSYFGIEYDYEVPDDSVVASPGGVSSTQHHYTKGFYGLGSSEGDLYAGEGNIYESGEYGNIYSKGQTAAVRNKQYPPQYPQNRGPPVSNDRPELKEGVNFDVKMIPPADSKETSVEHRKRLKLAVSPLIVGAVLIISYVALGAWTEAGKGFLAEKIGRPMTWKLYLGMAMALTILILAISYMLDVPLFSFEEY